MRAGSPDTPRSPDPAGRVLFVGNFLSQGGGRRAVCEELAERLAAGGWRVRLTSGLRNPHLRPLDMLWTVFARRGEYDSAHVDVFSGRAFQWARLAAAALRKLGKPTVLTLRGGNLPRFAGRHPERVRALLSSAAAVTAPSAWLQRAMAPYRSDIVVVPNALDIASYPFRRRAAVRPRLVWIRAFHEVYRPETAVEVLDLLRADFPDARLTMIGPDKGDGSLGRTRAAAARLGVADRVEFVEGVAKRDVPDRLAEHDVFLNTTSVDNVPVSVLEALACGLCVVTTDAGGLPDLLRPGRDALLTSVGDAGAMAASVRRLLTEPELAATLSETGRALAEASDWSRVLRTWSSLLRSAPDEASAASAAAIRDLPRTRMDR